MADAKKIDLPTEVREADLKYPSKGYKDRFEMYYTERFGWCIPTLFISRGKRGQPDRSYAISARDRQLISVGNGPHVLRRVDVYVTEKSEARLAGLLRLKADGEVKANEYRDMRASRRTRNSTQRWGF